MVYKEYCDECGKQLSTGDNVVSNRVLLEAENGLVFQVLIRDKDQVWNRGSLCIQCAKKLFATSVKKEI